MLKKSSRNLEALSALCGAFVGALVQVITHDRRVRPTAQPRLIRLIHFHVVCLGNEPTVCRNG